MSDIVYISPYKDKQTLLICRCISTKESSIDLLDIEKSEAKTILSLNKANQNPLPLYIAAYLQGTSKLIFCASDLDFTIGLVDTDLGTIRHRFSINREPVVAFQWLSDTHSVLIVTDRGSICHFNMHDYSVKSVGSLSFLGNHGAVWAASLSRDEKALLVGYEWSSTYLINLISKTIIFNLSERNDGFIASVDVTEDGKYAAISGKELRIIDMASGKLFTTIPFEALTVKFAPNSELVACTSQKPVVQVWNFKTMQRVTEIPVKHEAVLAIGWAVDSRQLFVVHNTKGLLRVWDIIADNELSRYQF